MFFKACSLKSAVGITAKREKTKRNGCTKDSKNEREGLDAINTSTDYNSNLFSDSKLSLVLLGFLFVLFCGQSFRSQSAHDRFRELRGGGCAANVARADLAFHQHCFNCLLNPRCRVQLLQILQQFNGG
jgi:hypothetical protein